MSKKLTILYGLPGSGLTKRAFEIVDKSQVAIRVSEKDLHKMLHSNVYNSKQNSVTRVAMKLIIADALDKGMDVVIDDYNLDKTVRNYWSLLGERHADDIEEIHLKAPIDECVQNLKRAGRQNMIPFAVNLALEYGLYPKDRPLVVVNLRALQKTQKKKVKLNMLTVDELDRYHKNKHDIVVIAKAEESERPTIEYWLAENNFFGRYAVISLITDPSENYEHNIFNRYFIGKNEVEVYIRDGRLSRRSPEIIRKKTP